MVWVAALGFMVRIQLSVDLIPRDSWVRKLGWGFCLLLTGDHHCPPGVGRGGVGGLERPGLTREENSRLACPAHSDCLIFSRGWGEGGSVVSGQNVSQDRLGLQTSLAPSSAERACSSLCVLRSPLYFPVCKKAGGIPLKLKVRSPTEEGM